MRTHDWLLTRVFGLRFPIAVMVKVCTFCTLCNLCLQFSEGLKCLLCEMLPELLMLFVFSSVRIHCRRSEHTSYQMAYLTHNKSTCHICVFSTEIKKKKLCVVDDFSGVSVLTRGGHVILGAFAKRDCFLRHVCVRPYVHMERVCSN